jgi:hypothetical protein
MNMIRAKGFAEFPTRLDDGDSASVTIANNKIVKALKKERYSGKVKIQPLCEDKTGKKFGGKMWKFDIKSER